MLLAGHLVLFILVGYIHWIVLVHMFILVFWLVAFFTGAGLYFSSRFKKTTTAVVMNIALGLLLWAILPFLLAMIGEISPRSGFDDEPAEISLNINPVVQAGVIMEGGAGRRNTGVPPSRLNYDWPFRLFTPSDSFEETTLILLATMAGYSLVGLVFAWRAKARLRRNVY